MCSLQGREQAFWKVLGTPGHVAEQLLTAALGLCIISDISVHEWGGVAQRICPQGRGLQLDDLLSQRQEGQHRVFISYVQGIFALSRT